MPWPFSSTKKKLTSSVNAQLEALKLQVNEDTRLYYLVTGGTAPTVKDDPLSFLTYRGQTGAIAQTAGLGFTLGAKVDIAQIFLPFSPLRAEAGGSLSMKGGKHRLLVLERQVDDPRNANQHPFALMNMKGYYGELKLGISAAVGVGYETTKDLPGAELTGFSVDLGASVEAALSYQGTYLRASDPAAQYFQQSESLQLKTALNQALTAPRPKAPDQMPWERENFLSMWTHTGEAGVTYSAKAEIGLIDKEKATHGGQAKLGISAEGNVEGMLKAALFRFQSSSKTGLVATQDTVMTFKRLGGKGIEFEASAKAGWGKWDKEQDDKDEEAWKKKSVSERAHTTGVSGGQGGITLGKDGPALKGDKDGIEISKGDIGGLGEKTTWSVVDSFSYSTAVWVWDRADMARAWPGSGFVRGHSVIARTLAWYYEMYPPQATPTPSPQGGGRARRGAIVRLASSGTKDKRLKGVDNQIRGLAKSLRVPLGFLIAFLDAHASTLAPIFLAPVEKEREEARKKAEAKSSGQKYVPPAEEESPADEAVIFEAAYNVDLRKVNAKLREFRVARFRGEKSDELPDFSKMFEGTLKSDEDHYTNLQALRIRIQNHKEKNSDKALFSAGVKLKVVSINFSIDVLDRFASGSTKTLAQSWFGDLHGSDSDKIPPSAVQPPILFF